jgi:hypothetical protein
MSCPSCGWPTAEAEVISRHRTSEGTVRYLRCVCGRMTIQVGADLTPFWHLSWEIDATSATCRVR